MLNDKVILVTGGTGSFGKKFTQMIFEQYRPKKVIIFSRDEFKQYEMSKLFHESDYPIRYFLGDIRDRERLVRAFAGVDYVVHAAALKQVPAMEYNPTEAVRTNVDGANNIVDAAIESGVEKVVALSTDKAVNPANLYGGTKLVSEKLFVAANAYSGNKVKFSVVRYGNVVGSRGSIVPLYQSIKQSGKKVYPVTDVRMTRFWITLKQGVNLVLAALDESVGGEIFIPKIPSMKVVDLAKAMDPECDLSIIGIRPGEKLHETLISEDEARNAKDCGSMYVVLPQFNETASVHDKYSKFPSVAEEYTYRSDINDDWLTPEQLRRLIDESK